MIRRPPRSTLSPTRRSSDLETYGSDRDGWLADFKVVGAEALLLAPRHLTFEEAATLPCAAVTAWSALAGVRAGDTVLTQGSDRKSTRLNSSHLVISYAVFCL